MKARRVSVAEAKDNLPALIHEAEASHAPVEITRRGKIVAVLLSSADYERRVEPKEGIVEIAARIREKYGKDFGFTKVEAASLRERRPARPFSFDPDE